MASSGQHLSLEPLSLGHGIFPRDVKGMHTLVSPASGPLSEIHRLNMENRSTDMGYKRCKDNTQLEIRGGDNSMCCG